MSSSKSRLSGRAPRAPGAPAVDHSKIDDDVRRAEIWFTPTRTGSTRRPGRPGASAAPEPARGEGVVLTRRRFLNTAAGDQSASRPREMSCAAMPSSSRATIGEMHSPSSVTTAPCPAV